MTCWKRLIRNWEPFIEYKVKGVKRRVIKRKKLKIDNFCSYTCSYACSYDSSIVDSFNNLQPNL